MGKYSESLNAYNTAIELGYKDAEIYNDRGKVKEKLGLLFEANDDYIIAKEIEIKANNKRNKEKLISQQILGVNFFKQGNYHEANKIFHQISIKI